MTRFRGKVGQSVRLTRERSPVRIWPKAFWHFGMVSLCTFFGSSEAAAAPQLYCIDTLNTPNSQTALSAQIGSVITTVPGSVVSAHNQLELLAHHERTPPPALSLAWYWSQYCHFKIL
jgi:hypothetical protein